MLNRTLLHETLINAANSTPLKVAVFYGDDQITYSDLLDKAQILSATLHEKGVNKGDRCVIYMNNTIESIISIYAILMLGAVFVIVNPQTKIEKLKYILNDSDSKILLTESRFQSIFKSIFTELKILSQIIVCDKSYSIEFPGVLYLDDIFRAASKPVFPSNIIENDLASLIYTSGSTGEPKGVMHTHLSMFFAIESLVEYLMLSNEDVFLVMSPLAFDYGLYQVLMSIYLGGSAVLMEQLTYSALVVKKINDHSVTVFPGVLAIFNLLISTCKNNNTKFPSVLKLTNTAQPLPPSYILQLKFIFPNALIYSMYGLTECKRVSYLEPEKLEQKPTSVGRAIPGTEVFILNKDGINVKPEEVGILYVRGSHIMNGYWKKPDLTKTFIQLDDVTHDRILCTHDWFKMDKEGDLYFIARDDDILKIRGEKVSPIEIENSLYAISGVKEAAVIGFDDPLLGETLKCFIALEESSELNELKIKRLLKRDLETFMIPKYIEFIPELPKTNTGKISKNELKKLMIE